MNTEQAVARVVGIIGIETPKPVRLIVEPIMNAKIEFGDFLFAKPQKTQEPERESTRQQASAWQSIQKALGDTIPNYGEAPQGISHIDHTIHELLALGARLNRLEVENRRATGKIAALRRRLRAAKSRALSLAQGYVQTSHRASRPPYDLGGVTVGFGGSGGFVSGVTGSGGTTLRPLTDQYKKLPNLEEYKVYVGDGETGFNFWIVHMPSGRESNKTSYIGVATLDGVCAMTEYYLGPDKSNSLLPMHAHEAVKFIGTGEKE